MATNLFYATSGSSEEEPSPNALVEYRANGEVSRMRNHKGNMPSLPQNKFCSLCPAKFTRTTHLNRHFRSHTNERSHRCEICHAEFTRSDLLTRHKRTCGDVRNIQKSRRKSCQSCADSKVKCDLGYPCAKCTARGRACVFVNDPETSRNRKATRRPAPPRPGLLIEYPVDTVLCPVPSTHYPRQVPPFSSDPPQSPFTPVHSPPQSLVSPSSSSNINYIYPSPVPTPTTGLEVSMTFETPNFRYSTGNSIPHSLLNPSPAVPNFDLVPSLANLTFDDYQTVSQLDAFSHVSHDRVLHHPCAYLNYGVRGDLRPDQEEKAGLQVTTLADHGTGAGVYSQTGNTKPMFYPPQPHGPLSFSNDIPVAAATTTTTTTVWQTPSVSMPIAASHHHHHGVTNFHSAPAFEIHNGRGGNEDSFLNSTHSSAPYRAPNHGSEDLVESPYRHRAFGARRDWVYQIRYH